MTRPIRIVGDLAFIPLTQGYEAVIDAADVPLVEGHNWCASVERRKDGTVKAVYAICNVGPRHQRQRLWLHRVLMSAPPGLEVDHRDGDGLNNRRRGEQGNLRIATHSQNQRNTRIRNDNTSGSKGVSWDSARSKWRAYLKVEGREHHLGRFDRKEDAEACVQSARERLHGEWSRAA